MRGVPPLRSDRLTSFPWLVHAFSTRSGGTTTVYGRSDDLNLGFTAEDDRQVVLANRVSFLGSLGVSANSLATVRQVHSAITVVADQGATPAEADGIITQTRGLLLGIQTADCVPILIADPRTHSVGAFHAGWRGTVQQIVQQGVAKMTAVFGTDPGELRATIGPSIGACCYQVGAEVFNAFAARFGYAEELVSRNNHLDLREANRRQLVAAGVADKNISLVGGCTSCNPDFYFSYRAQQGRTGRMLAVIGLR